MSRLKQKFKEHVLPALQESHPDRNIMDTPSLKKVVISMGLADALKDKNALQEHSDELALISGQKPIVTRSKKAISNFKLREDQPIGLMVTLRGDRMYEGLDRRMNIALPRVRDFRGVSPKGFDGRGNYTLGLKDQLIFLEIDYLKVDKGRGMNVSVVTTAKTDEEARKLLQFLGMPFRTGN